MPQEFGDGFSRVFIYSADELEQGLERHPQLSKELPGGGQVILRKLPADSGIELLYRAEIIRPGQRPVKVWARTAAELADSVHSELEQVDTGEQRP